MADEIYSRDFGVWQTDGDRSSLQIPAEMEGPVAMGPTDALSQEDLDYLDSIADIVEDMKPFDELIALSSGCPDPDRYGENEG